LLSTTLEANAQGWRGRRAQGWCGEGSNYLTPCRKVGKEARGKRVYRWLLDAILCGWRVGAKRRFVVLLHLISEEPFLGRHEGGCELSNNIHCVG
jgi:hypothetical protein